MKGMSGEEVWSFDFCDFDEPPLDEPFDFLRRECLGTAGRSCDGESFPRFNFRLRLACRVLPDECRFGESNDTPSVKRCRLECFGASKLHRGELAGEVFPADLICRSRES